MIKIKGKIKNCRTTKLLIIHSKKLSEKIIEIGNKINIQNFKEGLILDPKGDTHVTIAADKRLQIAITKLVKKGRIELNNQTVIPIYLDESKWKISKNDILKKSIGDPSSEITPEDLTRKNAALSKRGGKYYLDISSKALYGLVKKNRIKCLLNKNKGEMIIIRSDEINARKLTPHSKKRVQIVIPKKILNKGERNKLEKKAWIPIILKLNLNSFGLEINDFYSIKEEKELVGYLIKNKVKIKVKEPSDPYDILLEENIGIEIHNSIPHPSDLITRHRVKPALVRVRILEADFLVRKGDLNKFFVIINEKWKEGKYIQEVIRKVTKKVIVIFTNFEKGWENDIGDKIITLLNDY